MEDTREFPRDALRRELFKPNIVPRKPAIKKPAISPSRTTGPATAPAPASASAMTKAPGPVPSPTPASAPATTKTPASAPPAVPALASAPAAAAPAETGPGRFDRILSRPEFKPLKAVLDRLGKDSETKNAALITTNTYQMFLNKLGYSVTVVKQIHEQDCYARLGPAGGIRAVVPLHDTIGYRTLVTLVNYDSTVTTTPQATEYYDAQLAAFKTQLMSRTGNAA